MGSILESTDVKNKLEDLSGVIVKPGENPYNALIDMCNDEPVGRAVSSCQNSRVVVAGDGVQVISREDATEHATLAGPRCEISTRPVAGVARAEGKHCPRHGWTWKPPWNIWDLN